MSNNKFVRVTASGELKRRNRNGEYVPFGRIENGTMRWYGRARERLERSPARDLVLRRVAEEEAAATADWLDEAGAYTCGKSRFPKERILRELRKVKDGTMLGVAQFWLVTLAEYN